MRTWFIRNHRPIDWFLGRIREKATRDGGQSGGRQRWKPCPGSAAPWTSLRNSWVLGRRAPSARDQARERPVCVSFNTYLFCQLHCILLYIFLSMSIPTAIRKIVWRNPRYLIIIFEYMHAAWVFLFYIFYHVPYIYPLVMCGYLWQQSMWLRDMMVDVCEFINGNEKLVIPLGVFFLYSIISYASISLSCVVTSDSNRCDWVIRWLMCVIY